MTVTTFLHVSNFSKFNLKDASSNPCSSTQLVPLSKKGIVITRAKYFRLRACSGRERWYLSEVRNVTYGISLKDGGVNKGMGRKRRQILVRFNNGFGFSGGGGGGRDDGATARLLGNIALAAGLTYLSATGQLGWLLDTIVSIWLFIVIVPIVGFVVFLWWAGRDAVRSSCPNCRKEFQVFKSFMKDDLQLCPYCGQPFSVVGNEFVKESVKFSNQSQTFGQAFRNFTTPRNGKDSGAQVVDVEAEVKDAE